MTDPVESVLGKEITAPLLTIVALVIGGAVAGFFIGRAMGLEVHLAFLKRLQATQKERSADAGVPTDAG